MYNLGTMYYIDDLLYPEVLGVLKQRNEPTSIAPSKLTTFVRIPIEIPELDDSDTQRDVFLQTGAGNGESASYDHGESEYGESEIITPLALPVHILISPARK